MRYIFVTLLVVTLSNVTLALFVLWHRPKVEVNRVFALTALAVASWTFTNAIFQWTSSVETAKLVAIWSYVSAIVLGASFLHFTWIFPQRGLVPRDYKVILWCCALMISLLAFVPNVVIRSVDIAGNRAIATNAGIYVIAFFMLTTSVWAFATLWRQHAGLDGVTREQSRYVLTGSALTATIGLVCNLLLPILNNYSYVWLGPTSSLFFVGFTVYAIIAHHLFDIRLIIKRTVLYALLLAGISAGYSVVEFTLTEALRETAQGDQHPYLANIGGAIAVSFCVAPVRRWLEDRLDDILYRHERKNKQRNSSHRLESLR